MTTNTSNNRFEDIAMQPTVTIDPRWEAVTNMEQQVENLTTEVNALHQRLAPVPQHYSLPRPEEHEDLLSLPLRLILSMARSDTHRLLVLLSRQAITRAPRDVISVVATTGTLPISVCDNEQISTLVTHIWRLWIEGKQNLDPFLDTIIAAGGYEKHTLGPNTANRKSQKKRETTATAKISTPAKSNSQGHGAIKIETSKGN